MNKKFKEKLSFLSETDQEAVLLLDLSEDIPELERDFEIDFGDIQSIQSYIISYAIGDIDIDRLNSEIKTLLFENEDNKNKLVAIIFEKYPFISRTHRIIKEKTNQTETPESILNEIENPTPSIVKTEASTIVAETDVVPEIDVMPFEINKPKVEPIISPKMEKTMDTPVVRPTETKYYKIDPYREPTE